MARLVLKSALGAWGFAVLFAAGLASAQDPLKRGSTSYFGGSSMDEMPEALQSSEAGSYSEELPIALTVTPHQEHDFFESLDAFLDADKNLVSLHESYMRALIPFETYNTFYVHSRDTHQVRYHSIERELELRRKMARQLRNYLLAKGIPKFLMSREETKSIGERYSTIVGQTEKITKFQYKSVDSRSQFGAGLNPFTGKSWIKWTQGTLNMEASRYIFRSNSSILSVKKQFNEFSLGTYYHIEREIIEPYYFEQLAKNLNYQVGVLVWLDRRDAIGDLQNYIRFTYTF
jgi:hypothetical protein